MSNLPCRVALLHHALFGGNAGSNTACYSAMRVSRHCTSLMATRHTMASSSEPQASSSGVGLNICLAKRRRQSGTAVRGADAQLTQQPSSSRLLQRGGVCELAQLRQRRARALHVRAGHLHLSAREDVTCGEAVTADAISSALLPHYSHLLWCAVEARDQQRARVLADAEAAQRLCDLHVAALLGSARAHGAAGQVTRHCTHVVRGRCVEDELAVQRARGQLASRLCRERLVRCQVQRKSARNLTCVTACQSKPKERPAARWARRHDAPSSRSGMLPLATKPRT